MHLYAYHEGKLPKNFDVPLTNSINFTLQDVFCIHCFYIFSPSLSDRNREYKINVSFLKHTSSKHVEYLWSALGISK